MSNLISYSLISFFAIFFGIGFPVLITGGSFSFSLALLYLLSIYVCFRLISIMTKFRGRLLELTFYSFVYIFLVIAPLVQIDMNYFPMSGDTYTNSQILSGIFVTIIGIIGYEIGIKNNKNKPVKIDEKEEDKNINLYFLFFLSLILMFYSIQKLGGVSIIFGGTRTSLETSVSLFYNSLLRVPIFVTLLFTIIKYKKIKLDNKKINIKFFLFIVVLLIFNVIGSNPFYTSRYWYGTVFISIFIILFKWKRNSAIYYTYAIILGFLIIFPYADVARDASKFSFGLSTLIDNLSVGDFDAFQQIMNSNTFVDMNGLSLGNQFLGSLLFFVPRSIWPNKPIGTGATMGEDFNYINTNISAPLWAEFNVNFGIIGIFVLFIIYGKMSSNLQKGYQQTKGKLNFYQVFVPFYAFYQIFLLRGDLMSGFSNLIPVVLFIWIGLKMKKVKFKRRITLRSKSVFSNSNN